VAFTKLLDCVYSPSTERHEVLRRPQRYWLPAPARVWRATVLVFLRADDPRSQPRSPLRISHNDLGRLAVASVEYAIQSSNLGPFIVCLALAAFHQPSEAGELRPMLAGKGFDLHGSFIRRSLSAASSVFTWSESSRHVCYPLLL
jgi:hypothetical protein